VVAAVAAAAAWAAAVSEPIAAVFSVSSRVVAVSPSVAVAGAFDRGSCEIRAGDAESLAAPLEERTLSSGRDGSRTVDAVVSMGENGGSARKLSSSSLERMTG
jgi:hypothetical protein